MNYDDVIIRRMRLDDLESVQAFCYEQLTQSGDAFNALRVSEKQYAWEMKRLRQDWLAQQRYFAHVALESDRKDAKMLGYGAAVVTNQAHFFQIEAIASLGELWVDPSYRRHGIGRTIVREIVRDVKSCGIAWMTAHLGGDERENAEFFRKCGFLDAATEYRLCVSV